MKPSRPERRKKVAAAAPTRPARPAAIHSSADLRRFHRRIHAAVTQPLTPNYASRKKRGSEPNAVASAAVDLVKPNDRLTSFERLEIYNKQYWFRLLDCLADDFPGLRAILGEKGFDTLSRAYLQACPSRSFTLRNLGQRLPAFVLGHPHFAGRRQKLAADMARFEWAQVVAFDGATRPVFTVDELLGADPARLRLALQPYITLLELSYPLDDFVLALKRNSVSSAMEASAERATPALRRKGVALPRPGRTFLAVHRHENSLYYKRLEPQAFALLNLLHAGKPLAGACAVVAPTLPGDPAATLRAWFSAWPQLGWFCRPDGSSTIL